MFLFNWIHILLSRAKPRFRGSKPSHSSGSFGYHDSILRQGDNVMDREKLKEELILDEGEVLHMYPDSLGYATIGVGRLIDKRKGGGITHEESMYLLDNDITKKTAQVLDAIPWIKNHPDQVQRALINMAFQMGVQGLLGFKSTLSLIQAKKYKEAADNALKSKWATQTPNRAKRVTDMIRKG